jgi:hypothetical protein
MTEGHLEKYTFLEVVMHVVEDASEDSDTFVLLLFEQMYPRLEVTRAPAGVHTQAEAY